MLSLSGDDCADVLAYARRAVGVPVRVFWHWGECAMGVRVIGV